MRDTGTQRIKPDRPIIGVIHRRIRSSSLQSLERGRPTEIDDLNGCICHRAAGHGVPAPFNQAVVKMIEEIEAGNRTMSLTNIDDPGFVDFRIWVPMLNLTIHER